MRAIGTQNMWFSFRGMKNTDESLRVRMLSMPTRPHPAKKGKLVDVPAAAGKLWQDEGTHNSIIVSIMCISEDNANIENVNAWLDDEGDLIFGDEPEFAYHAKITKEFARSNRSQRLRGQEFTIQFDCEPYRYSADPSEDDAVFTSSGEPLNNPGTVASEPLIRIDGSGSGTLMIGQNTLIFTDIPATIYVDCDAKICYTGADTASDPLVLATQHVTGEWMRVEPGLNFVSFTGGITSVAITPRWRWL